MRGLRVLLRHRVSGGPPAVFLLTRRIAAGELLITAAVVLGAAAFSAFAFSSMLSASLNESVAVKAFVATGGDFQGFVDPALHLPRSLPVAATIVSVDGTEAQLGSARRRSPSSPAIRTPISAALAVPTCTDRSHAWLGERRRRHAGSRCRRGPDPPTLSVAGQVVAGDGRCPQPAVPGLDSRKPDGGRVVRRCSAALRRLADPLPGRRPSPLGQGQRLGDQAGARDRRCQRVLHDDDQ